VLTYYARLKTFFAYLVKNDCLDVSPLASLERPVCREDEIQPFSRTDLNALLHAASQSYEARRNKAILLFLLDTGLRASELCRLRMEDVDPVSRNVCVLGKGNKRRTVCIGDEATRALLAYLNECDHRPEEVLFFSWDKTDCRDPLSRSGLLQLIHRLGKAAGIKGVRCSPHTMRHTFAVEYLRNQGDNFSLQKFLGHTSLEMCRRYLALAQADLEAKHRLYSPADNLRKKRH
jgi:integrase/recombinase XerC/integrase/recombinase XerD